MTKDITVFKRYEIKFRLSSEQRAMVEEALADRMSPDAHGQSTICNIYYDTPDFRLIRRSQEKPEYKEKIRLRSYGKVDGNGKVFLELKKKYDGVVYKRRIEMADALAEMWVTDLPGAPEDSQIGREIQFFRDFYKTLRPAVYLCYDRCAYFSKEDPNLRITFDRNIRWRAEGVTLTAEPGGEQLLGEGESLMEVKTASALPLWLVEVLQKGNIKKASFSKYGTAYQEGILKPALREGRIPGVRERAAAPAGIPARPQSRPGRNVRETGRRAGVAVSAAAL